MENEKNKKCEECGKTLTAGDSDYSETRCQNCLASYLPSGEAN